MPKKATPIYLKDSEKSYLQSIVQKGTVEARVYRRAKALLLKSERMSNKAIADKLDITVPTVYLCLSKYASAGGDAALEDNPGRSRKPEIFDDSKAWVINIACQKPSAFGLSAELWYSASLTKNVNSVTEGEGYPRMAEASIFSIRKILHEARLNPHKATYYCEKRNPDFDKKCMMSWLSINSWISALMERVNSYLLPAMRKLSIRFHMTKNRASRRYDNRRRQRVSARL